jgi:simple sugar transport system ATP-binding protein
MLTKRPILEMYGIHKRFAGFTALNNVSFRLFPGEVHALMGENGAGKSTLIKVLTGVYKIDEGRILLNDQELHAANPYEAQEAGIATVYQEVNLCPNLTVAENIFIGREPRRFGRILWKEMNRRADELLRSRLHVSIDVSQPLGSYSVAIQQLVAIARALSISARILVLDEPTSSLDRHEVEQLFAVMRNLRQQGLAILFVTHFLDQVYEISDRITILRSGELVGEYMTSELPRLELVKHMIGKELQVLSQLSERTDRSIASEPEPFLEVQGLGRARQIEPFDLEIHRGEIVGFAGLLGSGRTEAARLLFGADRADRGHLRIAGERRASIESPQHAIRQGIAFCSENRKTEGIIADLSVRENIILALQARRGWYRALSRKRQEEIADEYIRKININPKDPEIPVGNLSGGNQQKVLLARWLLMEPKLFILDEPTRGIDIGAKTEIQKLVLELSEEGMAVLFISSELEEVIRVSDRIAVLRDRRLISVMERDEISQENVMKAIAGG